MHFTANSLWTASYCAAATHWASFVAVHGWLTSRLVSCCLCKLLGLPSTAPLLKAAASLPSAGKKVALCELPFGFIASDEEGGLGGTCVLRGCIPKKLLVYGSEFAEAFREAQGYG